MTAFMEDPDVVKDVKGEVKAANVMHSTDGASAMGYKAALVTGVISYGWAVPTIVTALGEAWLDDGWIDVEFRRPIYPDEAIRIRILAPEAGADGVFRLEVSKGAAVGPDLERCLVGTLGLGKGPFFAELSVPSDRQAKSATTARLDPQIGPTPEVVLPLIGKDMIPMAVPMSEKFMRGYLDAEMRYPDDDPLWGKQQQPGRRLRLHPGHMAQQCTPLFIHNVGGYKAGIHVRSQVQHLGRGFCVDGDMTVAGHGVEAYERKGHQYVVLDVSIGNPSVANVARIRHHLIYQPAQRPAR